MIVLLIVAGSAHYNTAGFIKISVIICYPAGCPSAYPALPGIAHINKRMKRLQGTAWGAVWKVFGEY